MRSALYIFLICLLLGAFACEQRHFPGGWRKVIINPEHWKVQLTEPFEQPILNGRAVRASGSYYTSFSFARGESPTNILKIGRREPI
jgi:hypothetical protein